MSVRRSPLIVLIVAMLALGGCAAPATVKPVSQLGADRITADMLLGASPLLTAATAQQLPEIDILELSPEMKVFLDDHVRGRRNENEKLRLLIFAVMGEGTFNLVYDETTRTAMQTFRDQRGNCLSFTNMFIAMARYLGLEAHYQEVEVPPDWSLAGQAFLLNRHVNVLLELDHGVRVVDFNIYDFKMRFDKKTVSDRRGRAHYYNNLGVEHMLAGDNSLALAHFHQSLREDDSFGPAWINLGILHRREAYPAYAEAAYLQALAIDGLNLVAMSNLANLYEAEGLVEQAAAYRAKVQQHRMENPYYRYMLANEAFTGGDYQAAIKHLEYAIGERPFEDLFYSLMSMSYLMNGDRDAAQTWMKKAAQVAGEDASKRRYEHKLGVLMSQGSEP
jgi:Flp pilus assembly protein TadD